MPPSVANCAPNSQIGSPRTAFRDAFTAHAGVSFFRASPDKTSPSQRVNAGQLHEFEFFTPAKSVGSVLVVDVDRLEAVLEIFETIPAEIHPSWVVETRKGAQAGWLIDPVDLRETAREAPLTYARAVGRALRAAVTGDEAVDPLTPVRVRNPTYQHADLRAATTPPVYGLRQLHHALKTAELWPTGSRLSGRKPHNVVRAEAATTIVTGNRNQTIFDVARHAAYAGEDFQTIAWETNDACTEPLPSAEVHGIIRSINRYMTRARSLSMSPTVAMPAPMREALAEMGRRGGSRNTVAQRTARALGTYVAARKRRDSTDAKARKAQRMYSRGHTRKAICEAMRVSASTVCRWLRRLIRTPLPRVAAPEHQVFRRRALGGGGYAPPSLCRGGRGIARGCRQRPGGRTPP